MIDLYYWTTPNGHKITIFLEEVELNYKICPIDISVGQQFEPDFLKLSPNNRIPAIVDNDPLGGGQPLAIFESGAILLYLAEKTGSLHPTSIDKKYSVIQWLMWQMGGFGPMLGQNHHFSSYAPEKIPYAIKRYVDETERLYNVLDHQLSKHEFVAGEFSIADIAIYPWVVPYERQQQNLQNYPNVHRWFDVMNLRPSVVRAYAKGKEINQKPTVTEEGRSILFGQTARTLDKNRRNFSKS